MSRPVYEVYVVEHFVAGAGGGWQLFLPHAYLDSHLAREDMQSHPDFNYIDMRIRRLPVASRI